MKSVAGARLAGWLDAPAFSTDVNAPMSVPSPGFGDQDKTMAGVSESLLHERTNIGGDGIRCHRGIAVVQNSSYRAGLLGLGTPERLEKGLERVMLVHQIRGIVGKFGRRNGRLPWNYERERRFGLTRPKIDHRRWRQRPREFRQIEQQHH